MIICFREKEVSERERENDYMPTTSLNEAKKEIHWTWQRCIKKWQGSEMRMYTIQQIQDQNFSNKIEAKAKTTIDKKRDGIER